MERLVRGLKAFVGHTIDENNSVLFRFLLVLLLGCVVMIGGLLRGVAGMFVSMGGMTMCLISLMTRLLVLSFFVQLGGLVVMFRRTTMMLCCGCMMLGSRMLVICHLFLPEINSQ